MIIRILDRLWYADLHDEKFGEHYKAIHSKIKNNFWTPVTNRKEMKNEIYLWIKFMGTNNFQCQSLCLYSNQNWVQHSQVQNQADRDRRKQKLFLIVHLAQVNKLDLPTVIIYIYKNLLRLFKFWIRNVVIQKNCLRKSGIRKKGDRKNDIRKNDIRKNRLGKMSGNLHYCCDSFEDSGAAV